ncbi:hypothetical protein BV379_04995 [Rhodovulum sulfidophilum]|nr:hypothetical protein BV379_04995 [Rhodovulum sulfidophilum]
MRYLASKKPSAQAAAVSDFFDYATTSPNHPMLKSAAISDAGITKQAFCEVEKNQSTRATYGRAIERDVRPGWGLQRAMRAAQRGLKVPRGGRLIVAGTVPPMIGRRPAVFSIRAMLRSSRTRVSGRSGSPGTSPTDTVSTSPT